MNLTVVVWRQRDAKDPGKMVSYEVRDVSDHASFLEMLDILNEQLIAKGQEPLAFDHDCREGICGMCSLVIDGRPHGPGSGATTCQLHMRHYKDGNTITIEPFRARGFPVLKDLIVDRTAFDRIMAAGGFITSNVGSAPDANAVPIPKEKAERAFEAAACVGCGACVASCPNGSAMLFVAAKLAHLHHLPQGEPERMRRTKAMIAAMDAEGFGACTNHYECEAACPKGISREYIAQMNRGFMRASLLHVERAVSGGD